MAESMKKKLPPKPLQSLPLGHSKTVKREDMKPPLIRKTIISSSSFSSSSSSSSKISPRSKISPHSQSPIVRTGNNHYNSKTTITSASGRPSASQTSTSKNKSSKHIPEKKEKKVYELPGQKHDPPDEREPLRIFYQSLYEENPKSEMAQFWMMEHGLLGLEAAKKAMERKKKSQFAQKLGLPTKTSKYIFQKTEKIIPKTPSQRSNSISNGSNKPLLNVKRKSGHDSDDDLILKPKKKVNMST